MYPHPRSPCARDPIVVRARRGENRARPVRVYKGAHAIDPVGARAPPAHTTRDTCQGMSTSIARSCVDHCRDRGAMRRTVAIALIVGTLLTLINLGDRLSAGDLDTVTLGRIAADYAVPWVVSSVGYIAARRTAVARAD